MAYTTPTAVTTGELITASKWNVDLKDNIIALRVGGIAIASQAANEVIFASSATQLARSAGFNYNGTVLNIPGQLGFPASQAAAAGANVLDDYEENTWTPNDQSGAALSFTGVLAHYVKIGQLVIAGATLTFPSTVDGTAANIGGLPFTVQNIADAIWGSTINFTNETTLFSMNCQPNTTRVLPYTNGGTQLTNANLSTDTFRFTCVYRATA